MLCVYTGSCVSDTSVDSRNLFAISLPTYVSRLLLFVVECIIDLNMVFGRAYHIYSVGDVYVSFTSRYVCISVRESSHINTYTLKFA